MYNQYAELVEKFESLQAEFKQASFEQKLVIERLNNQHKDEIAELKAHYEQEIDKRDKEIADLKAANEKLNANGIAGNLQLSEYIGKFAGGLI